MSKEMIAMTLNEIEDMVEDYNAELLDGEPLMTVEEMIEILGFMA